MNLALITNWRAVLTGSWTMRMLALAGLLEAVLTFLPEVGDLIGLTPLHRSILTIVLLAAAAILRLIAQPDLHPTPAADDAAPQPAGGWPAGDDEGTRL